MRRTPRTTQTGVHSCLESEQKFQQLGYLLSFAVCSPFKSSFSRGYTSSIRDRFLLGNGLERTPEEL